MGQSSEDVAVGVVRVLPHEVQVEVLATHVGERGLEIDLETIKFHERRSVPHLDLQHPRAFPIELLHQMPIKGSFLVALDIDHGNEIHVINILLAIVDDLHVL